MAYMNILTRQPKTNELFKTNLTTLNGFMGWIKISAPVLARIVTEYS